jgi:hypothetical protein
MVHCSSKRQSTVETATYATEFIAGRTCLDEALAIRYELQMLGAPLEGPIWIFGDNQSMINSSSEPSGRLTKRHLILSWHRLREKAAMKIVYYLHIGSKENIADCLTKHLTHVPLWNLIKEHLFLRYQTEDNVIEAQVTTVAPTGECQAGNGIGSEQVTLDLDDPSLHPVFYDGHWHRAPKGTVFHPFYSSNADIPAPWAQG